MIIVTQIWRRNGTMFNIHQIECTVHYNRLLFNKHDNGRFILIDRLDSAINGFWDTAVQWNGLSIDISAVLFMFPLVTEYLEALCRAGSVIFVRNLSLVAYKKKASHFSLLWVLFFSNFIAHSLEVICLYASSSATVTTFHAVSSKLVPHLFRHLAFRLDEEQRIVAGLFYNPIACGNAIFCSIWVVVECNLRVPLIRSLWMGALKSSFEPSPKHLSNTVTEIPGR